jgi:predicted site-specific integrase-resolvase
VTGRVLLTATGVAEMVGVSPATVLRWARGGALPSLRLPSGAVRFDPDALGVWLRSCEARGDAWCAGARGSVNANRVKV